MRRRKTDHKLEALRAVPGLGSCPHRELLELGRVTDELELPPDTVLVREGRTARGGWILLDGAVVADLGGLEAWRAGAGAFVGDLGVFGASPASVSVRTASPVRAFGLEPRAADVVFRLPTVARWLFAQLDLRLRSVRPPVMAFDPGPATPSRVTISPVALALGTAG